jgi:hypothetical protein
MDELVTQQSRGETNYKSGLRALFYGLWRGVLSDMQFSLSLNNLVRIGLEGARECGVLPDEFTPEERTQLSQEVFTNIGSIEGAIVFILENSKANKGKWGTVQSRLSMWQNRYAAVRTRGAALACKDKKKVWRLGPTKKHCVTCLGLTGRVYRYETWVKNVLPGGDRLACRGFNCRCYLEDTDERITPGPFPTRLLV